LPISHSEEKEAKKTFIFYSTATVKIYTTQYKVFWFFFSKKNILDFPTAKAAGRVRTSSYGPDDTASSNP
jgi:RNA recognition motif-containing protein